MKYSILTICFPVLSFIIISSCNKDENNFTPIPDDILVGDTAYDVYDTTFVLNAKALEEGLTGYWEVLDNILSYELSDASNPNCRITGKYRGQYKLRWTVTNGIDEANEDVYIRMFKTIPETIIADENNFQLYVDSVRMNAAELTEGLTGHWDVIESTHLYALSDIKDPKCLFKGELLGYYKVRWTVSNGKDEKYEDVDINIIGFTDSRKSETYKVVKIGDQIWMAENLRATDYSNGDEIADGTGVGDITEANDPKYWFPYNDDLDNVPTYGRLYTWYTLDDSRNVCPSGWHVPTNAEWSELVDHLGGEFIAGGKLKENGTLNWFSPNEGATNESGFTALPGGMRGYGGPYGNLGYAGNWWSLTENTTIEAYSWGLSFNNESIYYGGSNKKVGFSIRCLKD